MNITSLKAHIDGMLVALVSKLFDKNSKDDWFNMVEHTISIVP